MPNLDYTSILNIVDIIIVAFVIYRVLLLIKGTRATPMLAGLAFVVVSYFAAKWAGLITLGWILGNFLSSIILVIVVVFQDEIRRGLTKFGLQPVFSKLGRGSHVTQEKNVEDISLACSKLSKERIGALVVIQRAVGLDEIVEEGELIDAEINRKLLYSIFVKDSSLHDGAVIIEGSKIKAAGCLLPLSFNPDLDPNLGTRHRAAVGLSERSDAIVIVISEETGAISLIREGRIVRNLDASHLRDGLHKLLSTKDLSIEEAV